MSWTLLTRIAADLSAVGEVGREMKELGNRAGLSADVLIGVELAVCEAINNAIVHAVKDSPDAWISISGEFSSGELVVLVMDEGSPVPEDVLAGVSQENLNQEPASEIENLRTSGWGLDMIDALCAEWSFQSIDGLNTFRLVFR